MWYWLRLKQELKRLSILSILLTQPAAPAAFVSVLHCKCLNTLQVLPVCSCLCPPPTHRTHTKEGQSSSASTDLREGKWITHFTHVRHIQQGSDTSPATCQEALVRNVLMWQRTGQIKHLGKERSQSPLKRAQNKQLWGKGKTRDAVHHPLMNSSQSESEFCLKEKTEWRDTKRANRDTKRQITSCLWRS